MKLKSLLIFTPLLALSHLCKADELSDFAHQCDIEIGLTVPDFNCDDALATDVPLTNPNGDKSMCDRPNVLNGVCDEGSRFRVLAKTNDAFVVSHCRKTKLGAGQFGDIAVIQHNKKNGATCFYQGSLGTPDHSGDVKAPLKGVGNNGFWWTPTHVSQSGCVACHNNGPLIRTPYLTQIGQHDLLGHNNEIPGAREVGFNGINNPYYFVGKTFEKWKAYTVTVPNNQCITCHRLGVSNLGVGGSAGDFCLFATGLKQRNPATKNALSEKSPLWMGDAAHRFPQMDNSKTPSQLVTSSIAGGLVAPTTSDQAAAQAINDCAKTFNANSLPNSTNCTIKQFTGKTTSGFPGSYTAVFTPSTASEIQVYGWTYSNYRKKYDVIWPLGWRLFSLQPYVVNGNVLYNAVWHKSTEGEIQVYGWTYTDYRAKYDALWPQGWRLKIIQPYVINGQVRYTAVWQKSTEGEIQVYGWSYADYRAEYDALWPQGWRLKMIQPYVLNGQVLYTAVWRPSTESEIQVYSWSYADYRAKYDVLWNQGWRLTFLQPHVLNGQVLYTAVWRPSTAGEIQLYGWSFDSFYAKYNELWSQGWRLKILQTY